MSRNGQTEQYTPLCPVLLSDIDKKYWRTFIKFYRNQLREIQRSSKYIKREIGTDTRVFIPVLHNFFACTFCSAKLGNILTFVLTKLLPPPPPPGRKRRVLRSFASARAKEGNCVSCCPNTIRANIFWRNSLSVSFSDTFDYGKHYFSRKRKSATETRWKS